MSSPAVSRIAPDLRPVLRFARGYRRFVREPVDSAGALARPTIGSPAVRRASSSSPVSASMATPRVQLLEIEDAGGLGHPELRADPSPGPLDESQVRAVFLAALEDDRRIRPMAEIWKQAEIVRLRRSAPLPTRMGKILPFHLVKLQQGSRAEST